MNRRGFIAGAAALAVAPRVGAKAAEIGAPALEGGKPGEYRVLLPQVVAVHGAVITVTWPDAWRARDCVFLTGRVK